MYLSLYCKVWKGYSTFYGERELETEHNGNILTPLLWPSALCRSCSPRLLNRKPRGPLCWLSLLHLISNLSGPQLNRGPREPLRSGVSFPTTSRSNSVRSLTVRLLVLTELYISSTSTQSPNQSLEWHVWLSSSGNNCHAVQRSLSSGASVYECTMAFTLSHFISQIRPRDLFRLLAIGMCHFLPVHHFEMAGLAGRRSKYYTGFWDPKRIT